MKINHLICHTFYNTTEYSKDGKTNAGKQRYKCKFCNYHFSVERRCTEKTDEQKRLALQLYLEGMGFRAIGRILNISYGTIFQWIKKWENRLNFPKMKPHRGC